MTPLHAVLVGAALQAGSGLLTLAAPRGRTSGERLAVVLLFFAAVFGVFGASRVLLGGSDAGDALTAALETLPFGTLTLRLDALAACFLLPVFVIPVLLAWYGLGYFKERDHGSSARRLRGFFGVLAAAMTLVIIAGDGITLLASWEVVAIAAFFLIATKDGDEEARAASWVYLVAAHIGTLLLFLFFALLHRETGSYAWVASPQLAPGICAVLFALALVGFGMKAGLMPLHVWLPAAHAGAPSHVSAMLSGVVLEIGVYGVVRTVTLLPASPPSWGLVLILLGCASAVFGALNAVAQSDLKRLLAYSSVENIGIVFCGLGAALFGRSIGRSDIALLGFAGALLHLWNHALMKSLAFLGAGAVIHATGTRSLDRLGGLWRTMPRTAKRMLVAVLSLSAVPPFNGFVSELLVFLAIFKIAGAENAPRATALAAAFLAMASALALAAFAKAFASTFLGHPRTGDETTVHDGPGFMTLPMTLLAIGCGGIGLFPAIVAPWLERAAHAAGFGVGGPALVELAPLIEISIAGITFLVFCGVIFAFLRARSKDAAKTVTWDCGYARPSTRMQYTASSSSQMLVDLGSWIVAPRSESPKATGPFPAPVRLSRASAADPLLERVVLPFLRSTAATLTRVRVFQQGRTGIYVLYVLVVLVVAFALMGLGLA